MLNVDLLSIIFPGLVVGMMVSLTHPLLGVEVLRRGIIFIDLAVAQIAGIGVILATHFLHDPSIFAVQASALSFALVSGLLFRKVEIVAPHYLEAIIGSSFVVASSLAILLLSSHPHGADEVQHIVSGHILFTSWQDIWGHAPIYALIITLWFVRPVWRSGLRFYILFALAITSSVQLVGVFVVFASLILPALVADMAIRTYRTAWVVGMLSVVLGMVGAVWFDLPAGPLLVLSYSIVACMGYAYIRYRGTYKLRG